MFAVINIYMGFVQLLSFGLHFRHKSAFVPHSSKMAETLRGFSVPRDRCKRTSVSNLSPQRELLSTKIKSSVQISTKKMWHVCIASVTHIYCTFLALLMHI